ncbi:MAG: head GIN domain-containing protein [Ardenticatenaceae bacterium]|nr:head GIN domain-containing protein [Ardenticatenaceae bacterium]
MNAKQLKILSLLVIIFLLVTGCTFGDVIRGSGNLVTESREVSDFNAVHLSGMGEVIITQSGEESLVIETDDNTLPYVTSEVRGQTLYLGFDNSEFRMFDPTLLVFTINVEELEGLGISGSGNIKMGELETDDLEVNLSGSGSVTVDSFTAETTVVNISGSGDVEMAGEADRQTVDVSGSGSYRAEDLRSETVNVEVNGSGNATVWATESIDINLGGSGSVSYYGNPAVNTSKSGSGVVKDLGPK